MIKNKVGVLELEDASEERGQKPRTPRRSACRHLCALSRKNFINWRRTVLGSTAEIVCPVLLMLILVWARSKVDLVDPINFDIYQLKKPFYPTAQLNLATNEWQDRNINVTEQGVDLIGFMNHSEYMSVVQAFSLDLYEPLLDPLGPYYFFPPHCITADYQVMSPYIAYIESDNQISRDMVQQLEMLQRKQRMLNSLTAEFIEAIQNPVDQTSFQTFMKLLDGGTQDEQVAILTKFGVPPTIITLIQFYDAATRAEDPDADIQTQLQAATVFFVQDIVLQSTQLASEFQTQISDLVNATLSILSEVSVLEAATQLGLSEAQLEELTILTGIFVPTLQNVTQIAQQLELNAEQQAQLEIIMADLGQSAARLLTNATALNDLLSGAITIEQFTNQTGFDVRSVAESVGMNVTQVAQVDALTQVMNQIEIFQQIVIAGNDAGAIADLALNFGTTQQQLDLLEFARNSTEYYSPYLTGVVLNMTQTQQDLLLNTIQVDQNTSADQADAYVAAIDQQFNFTSEQIDNISANVTGVMEGTSDQKALVNAIFAALTADAPTQTSEETFNFADTFLSGSFIDAVQATVPFDTLAAAVANATSIENLAPVFGVDEATTQVLSQVIGLAAGNETSQNFVGFRGNQTNLDLISKKTKKAEFGAFELKPFESKEQLWAYIQHPDYEKTSDRKGICFGFHVIENASNDYELDLFFNDLWPTNIRSLPIQRNPATDPTRQLPDVKAYGYYVLGGFSFMQNWVANTILRRKVDVQDAQIVAMISPMKNIPVVIDFFKQLLQLALVFFVLLMYIPVLYRMVYRVVYEKTNRVKESLRMVGMSDTAYWTSWLLYYTSVNTLLVTLVWAILLINVFHRESAVALYMILWLYGQSLFGIVLIAQSVFQAPRAAAITSTVFYFGISILQSLIDDEDEQRRPKLLMSLFFPQIAMIQTFVSFVEVDANLGGVTAKTVGIQYFYFSVQDGILCFICSGLIVFVIGCYLEAVMPKTYGQRRHPLFFLGCPCKKKQVKVADSSAVNLPQSEDLNSDYSFESKYMRRENFEPAEFQFQDQEAQDSFLQVSDLRKKYDNGFRAVNGINLKMYSSQIFVLLGHNGAGKSTMIGMLTGLLQKTEGAAKAFGIDLFNNVADVRKLMGVCPQHDVLFEFLTTEEHLSLYYDLKGGHTDKRVKAAEIAKIMRDIGLFEKRNALAQHLSGGNKRKLSVAIALIGGSKFVLLDEPSSGLDLQARRQLWNMLKEYKKDRIVLLTTHYMDEADILGDRIGIMANGKMTCLGSSMFLKEKFGFGYNLSIVKKEPGSNQDLLVFLFDRLGSEIKVLSEVSTDLKIQIPLEYASKFQVFFEELDSCLNDLNVLSYGISISTLEEVFLRIGHLDDPSTLNSHIMTTGANLLNAEKHDDQQRNTLHPTQTSKDMINLAKDKTNKKGFDNKDESTMRLRSLDFNRRSNDQKVTNTPNNDEDLSGRQTKDNFAHKVIQVTPEPASFNIKDNRKELDNSFCNHLTAVLAKRLRIYKRNRKAVFNEVILPAIIMVAGFLLSMSSASNQSDSRIQTPERLPFPQKLLMNNETVMPDGVAVSELAGFLPQGRDAEPFDVRYDSSENQTFSHFGMEVYDFGRREQPNPPNFMYGSYQIYEANRQTQQYKFVSFVNSTSQDVAGLYPQFMYESILKTATEDPDFKFTLRSSPYPITAAIKNRLETLNSGIVIFITAVGYSVLLVGVVSYLVIERTNGLKHLQEVSNLKLKAFWIGNFIVDFLKLQFTIIVTIICFFTMEFDIPNAWITYLLIPFSALPFTYASTFLFTSDSAAQTFTMFLHFLVLAILSFITFILRLVPKKQANGDRMNQGFKAIPTFLLASSVQCDSSCELLADFREQQPPGTGTGGPLSKNPWHITNNLGDLIWIAVHFVVWFALIALIEASVLQILCCWSKKCCRPRNKTVLADLDEDVEAEAALVKQKFAAPSEMNVITVNEFKKVYRIWNKRCLGVENLTAVNNLSFSVDRGDCFCLLGVNGAGKSTTFKSLTKQVEPTQGSIMIGGIDIARNFNEAKRIIGYCPQPNLIFDYMSVEDHLWYYARIKGIPKARRSDLIQDAIRKLGLNQQLKKAAGTLSGGNKRKLCVAMAILGNPPIILLDEPSAGMDPEARRFMWQFVESIQKDKSSAVVLTTHSMEEAEALSTKMGIMVKGGVFKCFGSAQHIRSKFGSGYIIELKLGQPKDDELWDLIAPHFSDDQLDLKGSTALDTAIIEKIESRIAGLPNLKMYRELYQQIELYNCIDDLVDHFGEVEVLEEYGAYVCLRVEKGDKSIGSMFASMAEIKRVHGVASYSVGQTTLEQIFQSFADEKFSTQTTIYYKKPPQEIWTDGPPAEEGGDYPVNLSKLYMRHKMS